MSNDAAMLERVVRELTETCRVCGCHGDSCSLPEGERCVWTDKLRTLCSSPPCQVAAGKSRRRHKWAVKHAERDARGGLRRAAGPKKRTTKRKVKGRAA